MRVLQLVSSLLVASLFAAIACSSSAPADIPLGAGTACRTVNVDRCGSACKDDHECPSGLYCNLTSTCSSDCAEGHGCPAGSTCDYARGRCNPDPSALDGGGNGDAPGTCPKLEVNFTKTIPTVVVLVDQSGSMTENFGGTSRWNAARRALVDPTNGVIKRLEKDVRFGLALYTSKDGNAGGKCPLLTEVALGLNNYAAIAAAYNAADPEDETPTGESLAAVANKLADPAIPGPKFIVLATDGEPDTCAQPNPQNGQAQAVAAAQAAFAKGIKTYYISVGSEVSAAHAQQMANAGQGLAPTAATKAKYYVANDPKGLEAAFNEIIYGVRSCTFKVDGKITDPKKGVVTLDGAPLGYGDPNGWRMSPDGTSIELVGAACAKIKSGDHKVSALFECGAVIK